MSESDKMFEELGYKKIVYQRDVIVFNKGVPDTDICFDIDNKDIEISTDTGEIVFDNRIYTTTYLSMQELQAINKKCKELRVVR